MRFQLFQHNVGRNLKKDIWYKENRQRGIVLGAFRIEFKITGQAKYRSIGDVGAI